LPVHTITYYQSTRFFTPTNCTVFVLPEDGRLVSKHVGDGPLIFVLIKTAHVVGVIKDVLWYKNAQYICATLKYIRCYAAFNEDLIIKNQKHEDIYHGSAPYSKRTPF
jgi:hypothetical protein